MNVWWTVEEEMVERLYESNTPSGLVLKCLHSVDVTIKMANVFSNHFITISQSEFNRRIQWIQICDKYTRKSQFQKMSRHFFAAEWNISREQLLHCNIPLQLADNTSWYQISPLGLIPIRQPPNHQATQVSRQAINHPTKQVSQSSIPPVNQPASHQPTHVYTCGLRSLNVSVTN